MKKLKKRILAGVILGCILFTGITAGAMSINVDGWLYHQNPLLGAPKAYAKTMGHRQITAKVTASKSGYTTKSASASKNVGTAGGTVETNWLSGPTGEASGTTFKSNHTGYSANGAYQTRTGTYTY